MRKEVRKNLLEEASGFFRVMKRDRSRVKLIIGFLVRPVKRKDQYPYHISDNISCKGEKFLFRK
jgi:hypothetical protein